MIYYDELGEVTPAMFDAMLHQSFKSLLFLHTLRVNEWLWGSAYGPWPD